MDAAPAQPAAASACGAFERLVLFDGVCGFCDRAVRWLIQRDPQGRLRYAPLQGPTAAALRTRHPEIPVDVDTMVYVDASGGDERVYLRSEAVLRACAELPRPPRLLRWVAHLPRVLTDLVYAVFVRSRYRLYGKLDACRIPTAEERDRFLD